VNARTPHLGPPAPAVTAPAPSAAPRLALLLLLAYLATALATLWWARQPGHVATLWYANAVAAALLLRQPPRQWPLLVAAVALAVLLANLLAGDTLQLALSFVPANVLEVVLAAWGMHSAGLAGSRLRSPTALLQLLLFGALLPVLAGAAAGAGMLALQGVAPFGHVWLQWFEGSAIGAMGMLPLAWLVLREQPAELRRQLVDWRLLMLLPMAMAVALLALAHLPFPFVVMALPLLLAAMLLEPVAVALVAFLVSLTGAGAMAAGVFVPPPVTDEVEQAFVYVAFAASLMPAQLLAAAMADLRDSHDRLQARERELARANQGLEQFVRMASHDLREPLNTITQFGRLLEADHARTLPADAQRYLQLMSGGAERMRTLLDDVLHFARVQRGALDDPHPVALDAVLADVLEALDARVRRSGAQVTLRALPVVQGHPSMLHLLFQNLLSNAIKFVPPGQVPQVQVDARTADGWALVTVADQGIGIAAADLPKLFQPFQRLHLRRQYEGTGLGLAMARQIAQAHGGDVQVQSEPGHGSRFTVRLPLAADGELSRPGPG
jgi:signal transduction histidine kinase